MATSGTISTTVFNTGKVIDHAYRACRLPAAAIAGEMIQIAKDELYLLLSDMGNTGVPLWCQTKYLLPMYIGQPIVPCPVGTINILNANIRNLSILTGTYSASEGVAANAFDRNLSTECVQVAPAGWIQEQLDTATLITTIGIMPGATGTWNIDFQYSDDGVAWTTIANYPTFAAVDGEWQWFDFGGITPHQFYRLKANGGTVLDVIELAFANNPNEIPVARLNKDDYFNLPDKAQQGRPVQYWLDRQVSRQNMNLWPAPDSASQFQQIVVLVHRHIMDVGTMTQTLEIPQRWFEAIVWMLAARLALITPDVKPDMIPITQAQADAKERKAWMEERDNSPMYLLPNLAVYTR